LSGVKEVTDKLSGGSLVITGTAVVTYDSTQIAAEQIAQAIEDMGYVVTGIFTP
jgi:copper chaperone CopZ